MVIEVDLRIYDIAQILLLYWKAEDMALIKLIDNQSVTLLGRQH